MKKMTRKNAALVLARLAVFISEDDDLGQDLERAHDWCDRQGLPKNEDLGERLAPWIDEHTRALRFAASEMERLTRERDGEREEREKVSAFKRQRDDEYEIVLRERDEARRRQVYQDAERLALLSREAWKVRAEAAEADVLAQCSISCRETERADKAEADNAALLEKARGMFALLTQAGEKASFVGGYFKPAPELVAVLEAAHPGAALLEDRKRIAKTLDAMDVPSEADEAEKGRACDFAGRVELLATWGQRGWREYRKTKDSEAALLERLRAAEKVVEAGRSVHGALRLLDNEEVPVGLDEAEGDLGQALAAYDALREGA